MFIPPKLCRPVVLCSAVCLSAVSEVQWQGLCNVCSALLPGAETRAPGP